MCVTRQPLHGVLGKQIVAMLNGGQHTQHNISVLIVILVLGCLPALAV